MTLAIPEPPPSVDPEEPPASANAGQVSMSVDSAGRVAAAWTTSRGRSTVVRVATAAAGGGRYSVHTVLATSTRPVEGLGVALGRRCDLTVVWVHQTGRRTIHDGWRRHAAPGSRSPRSRSARTAART